MDALREALSGIPEDVALAARDELIAQYNASVPAALARQAAAARIVARQDLAAVDGIGEQVMQVDPAIFHWWDRKLPGCWRDKEFRDWFKKNFPETVVKCKGSRKTTLLMPGLKKCG